MKSEAMVGLEVMQRKYPMFLVICLCGMASGVILTSLTQTAGGMAGGWTLISFGAMLLCTMSLHIVIW